MHYECSLVKKSRKGLNSPRPTPTKMAVVSQIIQRGQYYDDSGETDKWNWNWLVKESTIASSDGAIKFNQKHSVHIRKIDRPGKAHCLLCSKDITYGSRGLVSINDHVLTKKHQSKAAAEGGNQARLPGLFWLPLHHVTNVPANLFFHFVLQAFHFCWHHSIHCDYHVYVVYLLFFPHF